MQLTFGITRSLADPRVPVTPLVYEVDEASKPDPPSPFDSGTLRLAKSEIRGSPRFHDLGFVAEEADQGPRTLRTA